MSGWRAAHITRDERNRIGRRARTRPFLMALALHGLLIGLLLLTSCTAMPAVAAFTALEARDWMEANTIQLPVKEPLDAGLPQTLTIAARDGTVLTKVDDVRYGRRTYVPLSKMGPYLPTATVATEDRRFFEHPGVDAHGLLRAVSTNADTGGAAQGASTIEMQLVRNLYLTDERNEQTLARKVKEALAALELDKHFTKDQLLEAYLNVVYYGHQAYGAEAAARVYFGKSAEDLTLAEAALIAGLPQSPHSYDPYENLDQAKQRQRDVLDRMLQAEEITWQQADEAANAPLNLHSVPAPDVQAQHFANYVKSLVRDRFGPDAYFTGGLTVQTTVDLDVQQLAEQVVANSEAVRELGHANNSAMVVMDPVTGDILAMVGSKDFNDDSIDGQVNVAVASRQPGSSIKPLVMLTAFEKGLNPYIEVMDEPTSFSAPPGQPPYHPDNYESHFYGLIDLRDALGNSLNVPMVKVLKWVGIPSFQDMARRLGITTLDKWDPRWLSLTLGGGEVHLLELTGAYTTIARLGSRIPPEALLKVQDSRGNVLYTADPGGSARQVVDPRYAYQVLHILGDPGARLLTFGPNTPLNLGRPHMVKTGTTDDYRDTWTMGCVPQVCVGVWMGNTNNDPMTKVSSSLTAGKMWVDMMNALIERNHWEPVPFPRPDGLIVKRVPNVGNSRPGQTDHEEVFLPGHEEHYLLQMDWMRPD
ncbi:MAG: PBP1A family penicillin-binding protein [Chloroflexi bacterium]|nr:PBP1A family penicillin-binding protein [Chloroflexota bacterium]